MNHKLLTLLGISFLSIQVFAGSGGGLSIDRKLGEVKKAECRSGDARLTFIDITFEDYDEGVFDSTNLIIEQPGKRKARFFVWPNSVLRTLPAAPELHLKEVAMIEDKVGPVSNTYFTIDIDFKSGEGTLSGARWNRSESKIDPPYMNLKLTNCFVVR